MGLSGSQQLESAARWVSRWFEEVVSEDRRTEMQAQRRPRKDPDSQGAMPTCYQGTYEVRGRRQFQFGVPGMVRWRKTADITHAFMWGVPEWESNQMKYQREATGLMDE